MTARFIASDFRHDVIHHIKEPDPVEQRMATRSYSAQQIKESGAVTLLDILQRIPGMYLVGQRVWYRGKQPAFMIDGIVEYTPKMLMNYGLTAGRVRDKSVDEMKEELRQKDNPQVNVNNLKNHTFTPLGEGKGFGHDIQYTEDYDALPTCLSTPLVQIKRVSIIEGANASFWGNNLKDSIIAITLKKGKELEEMDTQAILNLHPEIVVVDELAHTNIEGSGNPKRWQDVMQLLDAGISVITAVNIQHIEGLNESVQEITGIEVRERVPDSVLATADEVVNIDLTADELIERLKAGKIYRPDKVAAALNNFFTQDNILQLRELALKEVALRVEKKVENEIAAGDKFRHDKLLAVIDSSEKRSRRVIRKTARMATHLNTSFVVLYVQSDREAADRIPLANQRYLINNLNLATELGGEIRQIHSNRPVETIVELCREQKISIVCTGRPEFSLFSLLKSIVALRRLIGRLSRMNIDLYIMS